jgi:hypothetical protein
VLSMISAPSRPFRWWPTYTSTTALR